MESRVETVRGSSCSKLRCPSRWKLSPNIGRPRFIDGRMDILMTDPHAGKVRRDKTFSWAVTAVTLLTLTAVLLVWSIVRFGSPGNAIGYASGERIVVDEARKSCGSLAMGEERQVVFRVRNLSGGPITLLGARSSCSCTAAKELPMNVPPSGTREIRVSVRGIKVGAVFETISILTDSPENPALALEISGQVPSERTPTSHDPSEGAADGSRP